MMVCDRCGSSSHVKNVGEVHPGCGGAYIFVDTSSQLLKGEWAAAGAKLTLHRRCCASCDAGLPERCTTKAGAPHDTEKNTLRAELAGERLANSRLREQLQGLISVNSGMVRSGSELRAEVERLRDHASKNKAWQEAGPTNPLDTQLLRGALENAEEKLGVAHEALRWFMTNRDVTLAPIGVKNAMARVGQALERTHDILKRGKQ